MLYICFFMLILPSVASVNYLLASPKELGMVGKSRAALSPRAYSTSSTLKFTVDFPFGIGINSLGRLPLVAVQIAQKDGNFQPGEFNEFVKGINHEQGEHMDEAKQEIANKLHLEVPKVSAECVNLVTALLCEHPENPKTSVMMEIAFQLTSALHVAESVANYGVYVEKAEKYAEWWQTEEIQSKKDLLKYDLDALHFLKNALLKCVGKKADGNVKNVPGGVHLLKLALSPKNGLHRFEVLLNGQSETAKMIEKKLENAIELLVKAAAILTAKTNNIFEPLKNMRKPE